MAFPGSQQWWWVFSVAIAVPALLLSALGIRTIGIETVDRRNQVERQQRQTTQLTDITLSSAMARLEQKLSHVEEAPDGAIPFVKDQAGALVFPRDRVYIAEVGAEPEVARQELPASLRDAADAALSAEAQGSLAEAARMYRALTVKPRLSQWARLSLARLQSVSPDAMVALDPEARSPNGIPVMLLAAGVTKQARVASTALAQLRGGRWWLSQPQRKLHDLELRAALRGLGSVDPGEDPRLREVEGIAHILRRSALLSGPGLVRLSDRDEELTVLILAGERSGVALCGPSLARFLTAELDPIVKEAAYALALTDDGGHILWGDLAGTRDRQAWPLATVRGWYLRAGAPPPEGRGRLLLWYSFVALLLLTLAFGVFLTIHTARREVELARLQADFTASVTHEFKTPLTGIRLSIERITGGRVLDKASMRQYFNAIDREADRLERLVNRLLETHRIRSKQNRYHLAPHSIIDIVENAVAHLRPHSEAKEIELATEIGIVPAEMDLDRTAIQDSIENLIDNAIKYSAPHTRVTVAAEQHGGDLRITVRDQGSGISADDLKRIFDPFYRAGRRGDREAVRGTGLGLPLVKAVAEGHGGSVQVSSIPGKGSEFRLSIPIRQEEMYVPSVDRG